VRGESGGAAHQAARPRPGRRRSPMNTQTTPRVEYDPVGAIVNDPHRTITVSRLIADRLEQEADTLERLSWGDGVSPEVRDQIYRVVRLATLLVEELQLPTL